MRARGHDVELPWRDLVCTRCGTLNWVLEAPAPYLKQEGFVGLCCMKPVGEKEL